MKTKLTIEQKDANKLARKQAKEIAKEVQRIESERNQKPIKAITINIEWHKSRTWGSNPVASAQIQYKDGTWDRSDNYTCSGCGYDKESTVIAEIFNAYLLYKLYGELNPIDTYMNGNKSDLPYGIYISKYRHFSGGIGTSCYYKIAEAIGGTFEHIASGKTFDCYKYIDNN